MAKVRVNFKVDGADEVLRNFNLFSQKARVGLRKVVKTTTLKISKSARGRVPTRSGDLRKSIKAKYTKDGFSSDITAGGTKAFYAHMVEFGTVKMPAHPFLFPSAEEQKQPYLNDLKGALKGAIKR